MTEWMCSQALRNSAELVETYGIRIARVVSKLKVKEWIDNV